MAAGAALPLPGGGGAGLPSRPSGAAGRPSTCGGLPERSPAPGGAAAEALELEPEPGGRRAAGCGEGGGGSPPRSPPAAAMRSEPLAWPPVSAQAAALLEEAADLLVLHRDFAAAVEKCEAGCDSLGPGPCPGTSPGRCERAPGLRGGERAALGSGSLT